MLEAEGFEHDLEITDVMKTAGGELEAQKKNVHRIKKEHDTLLRGIDIMDRDRQRTAQEQREQAERETKLREKAEDLARSVVGLKHERQERESTLRDKEAKISAYKVKVNTLKKFKDVLDFRLREVTASLEPKDNLIGQLNAQLKELEAEFEMQLADDGALQAKLEQKDRQISNLTVEAQRLRSTIKAGESKLEHVTKDLDNLVNNQKDIRTWPKDILRIYHEHVKGERHQADEDQVPLEELKRQIMLMERKVTTLAVKGGRTQAVCKMDIQKKAHENSLLIHELNELRVEKRTLQSNVKALELKLKGCEQENHGQRVEQQQQLKRQQQLALQDGAPSDAITGLFWPRVPKGTQRSRPKSARGVVTGRPPPNLLADEPSSGSFSARGAPFISEQLGEDKKRIENLMLTAELSQKQVQMQKLENKILRDQVDKMLKEKDAAADKLIKDRETGLDSPHAAGSGHAVAAARHRHNTCGSDVSCLEEEWATSQPPSPIAGFTDRT